MVQSAGTSYLSGGRYLQLNSAGECKSREGFISAENVKMDDALGLRLSRSSTLSLSTKNFESMCFALENTALEEIGKEKGAITLIKVRVKEGHCKDKEGWVSKESLKNYNG